jgi:hypothetical protein
VVHLRRHTSRRPHESEQALITFPAMTQSSDPDSLPPHVFKIAHSAFTTMIRSGGAQSILISGESGAGKTEATKLCMACLAEISGSSGKGTESALESGILLEAFGNAKTVRTERDACGDMHTCTHTCTHACDTIRMYMHMNMDVHLPARAM